MLKLRRGVMTQLWVRPASVADYLTSGLAQRMMDRELADDRLLIASALAAGDALATAVEAPAERVR